VVTLWRDYRSSDRRGWVLPLALAGVAGLQWYILTFFYPEWGHRLAPALIVLCAAAVAGLVLARLKPLSKIGGRHGPLGLGALSVGVASLLLAPAVWAASTLWYGAETRAPSAGPQAELTETSNSFGSGGEEVGPLMGYLRANQGDAEYLVAAIRSRIASPIILNTDEPVISFGGFNGRDPVFSNEELAGLVSAGAVRFFVIEERDRGEGSVRSVRWITGNCEQVRQASWRSTTSTVLLYGCGTGAR
jgi:4-amino-4-deoxy-L-arabinose transferase-like glycosyltransferase